MTDRRAAAALRAMGRDPGPVVAQLAGSASGSGVYAVGADQVLKVTTADRWREPARRELRCYRELADGLPVAVPRLLDWVDTDAVTAVLLSAHRPAPPAREWSEPEWLDLARQLGTLHTVPAPARAARSDWLAGMLARPSPRRVGEITSYWRQSPAASHADTLLAAGPRLAAAVTSTPECFVHGDCHVGNMLRAEDGTLVWADWQGVGIGHGESELGFLWSRASTDWADPPRQAMTRAYAAARGVDVEITRRCALAAELGIVFFAFPEYAAWNSPEQRDRVTARLITLAEDWARSG